MLSTSPDLLSRSLSTFSSQGQSYAFASLPKLGQVLGLNLSRLPVSLRIVLEAVLRKCDHRTVTEESVRALAAWNAQAPAPEEIPFTVARIVLQDFTGVPLLVDLAAMRDAVRKLGKNPKLIEPLVPVDLVVDHSVQVDYAGTEKAFNLNLLVEFQRNRERYQFLKWGQQAFDTFKVVPPGIGIVHQVNLEYLAKGVLTAPQPDGTTLVYPDTLVGTDSHTTMINGLGIVGWGVGGIEAEAGMLGQPIYFLTPEVVGVHLTGQLGDGVTATDLALHVTQMLRAAKVVGKFVEFFGPGAAALPLPDRATIANMAPEYGATMGFFPLDDESLAYLRQTGRSEQSVQLVADYFKAQELFGIPGEGQIDYSLVLPLDLATVEPSVAGPKRPQDRVPLHQVRQRFTELFSRPVSEGGYGRKPEELSFRTFVPESFRADASSRHEGGAQNGFTPDQALTQDTNPATEDAMVDERPSTVSTATAESQVNDRQTIGHGSVLIAAITSCTNTSNPTVMLAAGLLAKRAVERGLSVDPVVKASLAPGSRVVTDYLQKTGLQPYLDQLGFNLVGYGCTTCIGNSGPLPPPIEDTVIKYDLIAASVLSGNRNFEARVHQSIKANFLMSPPLVVAFALAGRVNIDLTAEPLGIGSDGQPVFLKDLWPSLAEIRDLLKSALQPDVFRRLYEDFASQNPAWNEIPAPSGDVYQWDPASTYIHEPPFFQNFSPEPLPPADIIDARALGIFGDSVTTDHISPAGSIKKNSPAGQYLLARGVSPEDFNSYGSRRGNDEVMTRGTFANVRIKNLMVPGVEGGVTRNFLGNPLDIVPIYDAAEAYKKAGIPLVVFGGKEYGTGSSRDWAAKGTALLGVRAVIAESFERIHRSNLVGMGVLPCCFEEGTSATSLGLNGSEHFTLRGLTGDLKPRQKLDLEIKSADSITRTVPLILRIDTPIEIDYYRHGGILPYVLRQIIR